MLKVGLTGGVACGKTLVLEMFERRGAYVIRADEIGHMLMRPGAAAFEKIVAAFGREILDADGTINRPKLAEAAFPDRIKELNSIIHPLVIAHQDEWMADIGRHDPKAVTIVEAALMIEAGAHRRMDRLVVVTCSMEQKVKRFAKRTGSGEFDARREVQRRMAAQLPEEDKAAVADYLIDNSGTVAEAESQVERVWTALKAEAERT